MNLKIEESKTNGQGLSNDALDTESVAGINSVVTNIATPKGHPTNQRLITSLQSKYYDHEGKAAPYYFHPGKANIYLYSSNRDEMVGESLKWPVGG